MQHMKDCSSVPKEFNTNFIRNFHSEMFTTASLNFLNLRTFLIRIVCGIGKPLIKMQYILDQQDNTNIQIKINI